MRSFARVLALLLAAALPQASAHYVRLADALVTDGVLTVGIALAGRPFSFRRDGVVQGFEIDLARAVAEAHDLELEVVRLPRGELLGALRAGRVDAINTLALARAEREEPTTVPYLVVGDHGMVLRGNPFRIRGQETLAGRTGAVTSGSSAERYAARLNERLVDGGLEPMNVHAFPDQRHTHFPVSMGHAAVYFVGSVSAVGTSTDPDSRTRLVAELFEPVGEVGLAVREPGGNLHHAVEHAIAAMVATGRYQRLLELHGLPPALSAFRD